MTDKTQKMARANCCTSSFAAKASTLARAGLPVHCSISATNASIWRNDIVREEIKEAAPHRERSSAADAAFSLYSPDDYVIGQSEKVLAVAVHNHYKRLRNGDTSNGVELGKSNILLIGPTGSGKTLLAKRWRACWMCRSLWRMQTTLTEAGYVGEDVENIIICETVAEM